MAVKIESSVVVDEGSSVEVRYTVDAITFTKRFDVSTSVADIKNTIATHAAKVSNANAVVVELMKDTDLSSLVADKLEK